jgi:hypothetical protein
VTRVRLVATIVLGAALVMLAAAASGSAQGTKVIVVSLTASGPKPIAATKLPDDQLEFVNDDSVNHRVVLVRGPRRTCSLDLLPGGIGQCHDGGPTVVGNYPYTVDGRIPATVRVKGYRKEVTLTADTHTIRAGDALDLHGRLIYDNGTAGCGDAFQFQVRILDRHGHGRPFERIATVRVGGFNHPAAPRGDLCAYAWHLALRPGSATSYIAESIDHAEWWQRARSRPFAVTIRR